MKVLLLIVLGLVTAITTSRAEKTVAHKLRKSWVKLTDPFKEECVAETGVNPVHVERIFLHLEYPEDDRLKCYMKCICIRLKLMNNSGEINVAALQMVNGVTAQIGENCYNETKNHEHICKKAFNLSRCFVRSLSTSEDEDLQ